ncbi:MAG: hypothetical protein WCI64_12195 [Chlorobium sp.]
MSQDLCYHRNPCRVRLPAPGHAGLYKQADVNIFDEATSALDNETEQAVMEALSKASVMI